MFLIVVIETCQLLYKLGKLLQNAIIWTLNSILSSIEKSTLAALVLPSGHWMCCGPPLWW